MKKKYIKKITSQYQERIILLFTNILYQERVQFIKSNFIKLYLILMDDSDNLLFTSLLQMKIKLSSTVTSLSDIKTEDLQSIIIQMLHLAGADVTSINELNKAQKFRVATKLNQQLTKQFNTQFELNDLMSSNLNVIRKILVTLMSKMSMVQLDPKNNERNFQVDGSTKTKQTLKKRQAAFEGWLKKEWIHPALTDRVNLKYKGFQIVYDIQGDDFAKKNIIREVRNSQMFYNLQSMLADGVNRNVLNLKRQQQSEGVIKHEVDSFQEIKNKNKDDWKQLKTNNKKMAKARKRLIQKVQSQDKKEESTPTIFQKQVQQLRTQTKDKEIQKNQTDTQASFEKDDPLSKLKFNIQEVKKQHQKQIQKMNQELSLKQLLLTQAEESRINIEEEITKKEDHINEIQQKIQNVKTEAQKVKRMVDGMNSPEGLQGDITKLKDEIKDLEHQANVEINQLKKQVKQIEKQSKQKITQIQDVKHNLTRIQEDYARIVRQLAQNQKRKEKVQLPTQGISRNVYNKKILENQSKLKQSKQQIQRMTADINKLEERMRFSISSSQRIQTQIQNLLIQDSKKYEDMQKKIKQIYTKYKDTYRSTIKSMQEINKIRQESREYQTRVREIANKNYKQTIEKLNSLMQ